MPRVSLDVASSIRLGLRAVQFVCSLIALATVAAGFRSVSSFGRSSMLGSHSSNFALLLTYTTMLYSLFAIVGVEVMRVMAPPQRIVSVGIDGAFAVVLFICGIVLATSDYVSDCDSYGFMLRCGNLTAGTVFIFIACGAFVCTAVLTFLGKLSASHGDHVESGEHDPTPYVEQSTPTALSPIGVAPSPSAKV